ncbi:hypothetical protein BMS3Abin04_00655 [bacterium BMS3Abin04]|nr:hypothetical protein BMS3Abin04_00655 [bacterium BMS3Abin04]
MRFFSKIIFFSIFLTTVTFAQKIHFGQAKGLFMSVGVGPRFPVGDFSQHSSLGEGINLGFSYTDNILIPVFFYAKFEYQHFPGDISFYRTTDYSNFTSSSFSINLGARHFFQPLIRNVVLLMPIAELGISYSFFENLHEFKIDTHKNNFVENNRKVGFHIGAGVSMFLLDVIASYNYYKSNQFISFDLKIRIPIFAKF